MATILSVNLGPYSLDLKLSHIHSGIQVSGPCLQNLNIKSYFGNESDLTFE